MSYSVEADLLLGEGSMMFSPSFDKVKFVNDAANEIDAKLGFIYKLPLAPDNGVPGQTWLNLPAHEQLLLKSINNRLATGRIYLTVDASGDGARLHAYGWQLVQLALADLMTLANGTVQLSAIRDDPTNVEATRNPAIVNHDAESMVDVYENLVHRGENVFAWPGEAP